MKWIIVLALVVLAVQADDKDDARIKALKECTSDQDLTKYKVLANLGDIPLDNEDLIKVFECVWRKIKLIKEDNTIAFDVLKGFASDAVKKQFPDLKDSDKLIDEAFKKCADEVNKLDVSIGLKAAKARNCFLSQFNTKTK